MKKESYSAVLERFNKDNLVAINTFLGLPRNAGKPKKVLAADIAAYVLAHMRWCLYQLPLADRHFLRQLVAAMPNPRVPEGSYTGDLVVESLGWVDFAERTDVRFAPGEETEYVFTGNAEVLDVVARTMPLVDEELKDRDLFETTANGLLNLYGFISYGDMVDLMVQNLSKKFGRDRVLELFHDFGLVNKEFAKVIDAYECHDERALEEELLASVYLTDDSFFDDPQLDYYVKHKPFTFEQVIAAGGIQPEMPFPEWGTFASMLCQTLKLRRRDAEVRRFMLWQLINEQHEIRPSVMFDQLVAEEEKPRLTEQGFQRLMMGIINFTNACPRWLFGGYSPAERFEARAATLRETQFAPQGSAADIYSRVPVPSDVLGMMANLQMTRPDDPCPCGSGKKYGECCGNN